jgi:hypothetical protein
MIENFLHEGRHREIFEIQFLRGCSICASEKAFELVFRLESNDFVKERLCDRAEVLRNEREGSKNGLAVFVGSRMKGARNSRFEDVAKELRRECRERSRKRRTVD